MNFALQKVGYQIAQKPLLQDVSLQVWPGEVLALLGPNGAGKSTLLKTLCAELRPSSGSVQLNGRPYTDWAMGDIAKMVAVLPQSSDLAFPFSTFEVVMLGRLPHQTGHTRDKDIAMAALAKVDMSHHAESLYPSLSGGERQRVQLARVLAQIWEDCGLGPRYLLLDEPTSALDLAHQHLILRLAKELAKEKVGVLAILHDLNLAAQYANRVALLQRGRLQVDGFPQQVLTSEAIARLFELAVTVIPHPTRPHPLIVAA